MSRGRRYREPLPWGGTQSAFASTTCRNQRRLEECSVSSSSLPHRQSRWQHGKQRCMHGVQRPRGHHRRSPPWSQPPGRAPWAAAPWTAAWRLQSAQLQSTHAWNRSGKQRRSEVQRRAVGAAAHAAAQAGGILIKASRPVQPCRWPLALPSIMRSAFASGRKSTMRSLAVRCAFMPSNTACKQGHGRARCRGGPTQAEHGRAAPTGPN